MRRTMTRRNESGIEMVASDVSQFFANRPCLLIALLLLALGTIADASSINTHSADAPTGWFSNGTHVQNYEIGVDTTVKHNGRASAHVKSIAPTTNGFGGFMQVVMADDYHGKRLRMSAWLKSADAEAMQ